ncbi:hypothetical protein RIF29_07328 [Crotalaria pallida]|uniref:WRKY domain-containing protein n=1 Tax=Crotalaria pallida TaxID=3830 RepID=A0AAN9J6T7_CROPI
MKNGERIDKEKAPIFRVNRKGVEERVVRVKVYDMPKEDCTWRRSGLMISNGQNYPWCISVKGCPAKKHVKREEDDPTMMVIKYQGKHCHSQTSPKDVPPNPNGELVDYSFPPSCVGEVGRLGAPSRREIGHGMLAERSLEPILPSDVDFPYTIRVESTITESNGSSRYAALKRGIRANISREVGFYRYSSLVAYWDRQRQLSMMSFSTVNLSSIESTDCFCWELSYECQIANISFCDSKINFMRELKFIYDEDNRFSKTRKSMYKEKVNKLNELYKESSEEWSRKAADLEGVIKAMESHLKQVEDEHMHKIWKNQIEEKPLKSSNVVWIMNLPFDTKAKEWLAAEEKGESILCFDEIQILSKADNNIVMEAVDPEVSVTCIDLFTLRMIWVELN